MTTKLPAATQKVAGIPNGMRTATVTAVSGGKVTINVSGGTFSSGVGVLTSYAPRVGDVVAVFRQDSSWLVLGPTSGSSPWIAMSTLGYLNGWVDRLGAGHPIGQYRITATEVQLFGEIQQSATLSAPSVVLQGLPAPQLGNEAVMIAAFNGTTRVRVVIDGSGGMTVSDASSPGALQLCCAYPLDARLT